MTRLAWPARVALLVLIPWLGTGPGKAADGACVLVHKAGKPPLDVLQCPSGPSVSAEASSDVHIIDPGGRGHPTGAAVETGGVLIDVPPGYPGGFQVTTPRAVASVRGTRWAVDVTPATTAVLVLRGSVIVARPGSDSAVVLAKGDGVDVGGDAGPLRVTRWPAKRVAKLLARFGQR